MSNYRRSIILTHNDIAHLSIGSIVELWKTGEINHLVTDFEITTSKDGKMQSITYKAKEFKNDN